MITTLNSTLTHKILTADEEALLGYKVMQGCEESRTKLIEYNLRLVVAIASSYRETAVPMEDIIQSGNMGLIKAVDKFDPSIGRFSTYAVSWIKAEISYLFDNVDSPMNLPLQTARAIKEIDYAEIELSSKLHRKPTEQELIEEAKNRNAVKNAKKSISQLLALRERQNLYLDNDMRESHDEQENSLTNVIEDTSVGDLEEEVAHKHLVELLLSYLTDREKHVINLYYGLEGRPMTLREIAVTLGVGEQRVQQIHRDILRTLKRKCERFDELVQVLTSL